MGMFDKFKTQAAGLKDQAVDAVGKNKDKISEGLDKAGDFVDKRTEGKYTDKIQSGKAKVAEGLEKIDKKDDGTPPPPTPA